MTDEQDRSGEVDAALADLAIAAVSTLKTVMRTAKNARDRIAAANSILDRVGYSRTPRAQAELADREIRRALDAALQNGVSTEVAGMLEQMGTEEREHWLQERARAERKSEKEAAAAADEEFRERKRAEDAEQERSWDAAAPMVIDASDVMDALAAENPDGKIPDFSELGPDDEENDAWLDA